MNYRIRTRPPAITKTTNAADGKFVFGTVDAARKELWTLMRAEVAATKEAYLSAIKKREWDLAIEGDGAVEIVWSDPPLGALATVQARAATSDDLLAIPAILSGRSPNTA